MKTSLWQKKLASVVVAGMTVWGTTALAQSSVDTNVTAVSAPAPQPQPQLAFGVPQIVQLTQAKIGDGTIVAYIKNSGISYNLDANQIIYLRQQGVSDTVITVMLNQPRAGISNPAPAPYTAPQTAYTQPATTYTPPPVDTTSTVTTAPAAPSVTYVQSVPAPTYYYSSPYYYPTYDYYPGYYYPPVSLSVGWGWGWHGGWGGGWHGGGGGWHGGGFHR